MPLTLNEFRQWLEGFEECFVGPYPKDGSPNTDQWAKIRAKLADVEAVPIVPVQPAPWPGLSIPPTHPGWPGLGNHRTGESIVTAQDIATARSVIAQSAADAGARARHIQSETE